MTSTIQRVGAYEFVGGYPTPETVERAYDDADLVRAIGAYRFFFPTVSAMAIWKENEAIGLVPNRVVGVMDTEPAQAGLTLNSDTPYGALVLDLRAGPVVVELPPGPLLAAAFDLNQRWLADMGVPGPDRGEGGTHVLVPPGWTGELPDGVHVWRSTTFRVVGGARAVPQHADLAAADQLIRSIRVHPLGNPDAAATWIDMNGKPQDTTPNRWEGILEFWRVLHEVVDNEPHLETTTPLVGDLAELGIVRGRPFEPDARLRRILTDAARTADAQLRVRSLADRRPDRAVWPGTRWEWASLRFEDGQFTVDGDLDVVAREKWFFQAIGASPAMFRRSASAMSLYWLGTRDTDGAFLDGGKAYTLRVPLPVPAARFWSVTVYDAQTRSQISTGQGTAALRSMFELAEIDGTPDAVVLFFGPEDPGPAARGRWVQTVPGRGWFVYFRIYGPQAAAFDGSWHLPDFQPRR